MGTINKKLRKTVAGDELFATVAEYDTEGNRIADSLASKVDKVDGKGLSSEDFTSADKTKLNGIASGAEVNAIESISINGVGQTPDQNRNVDLVISTAGGIQGIKLEGAQSALTPDVNNVVTLPLAVATGAQNATDGIISAADKAKLGGIESGAEVNTISSISVQGTTLTPDANKNVEIPVNDGVLSIKVGSASTVSFSANQNGDASVDIPLANKDVSSATPVYEEGLMTSAMVEKLDKVTPEATKVAASQTNGNISINDTETTVYVHPTLSGYHHIPSGGQLGNYLQWSSDGSASWGSIPVAVPTGSADATDGLMTAADKLKLNGIQAGAQVNAIETITVDNGSALPITNANVNIDLSGKVDVVQGKGLSTNDYTNADKDIVDNANAVIPSDATAQNQLVSQSTLSATLADFGGFKVVPGDSTTGEPVLPSGETASTKIIYLVKDSSATGPDLYKEWIWNEGDSSATPPVAAHWDLIGDTSMDLSGYVELPSTHTDTHLVVFGPNNDIVDSGKTVAQLENAVTTLSIGGGSAISPTTGTTNIDIPLAANFNGTGSAGAMSGADKVKLDGIAAGAEANVQADWAQTTTSADDYIKNKPAILSLAHDSYVTISESSGTLTIGLGVHTGTYTV